MLELQQQFVLDFVILCRSWIDDPPTWSHGSRAFNAFSKAILRLASWDFHARCMMDVRSNTNPPHRDAAEKLTIYISPSWDEGLDIRYRVVI